MSRLATTDHLRGTRWNRLTVIDQGPTKDGHVRWVCICDCGTWRIVRGESLRDGTTKSCGCLQRESATKHGMKNTPEYRAWQNMKTRCENPDYIDFHLWGGRGIKICQQWRNSFKTFFRDMGRKPSPELSLDREDNEGDYTPANCRWATAKQQANNRRKGNRNVRRTNSSSCL